MQRGLKMTQNYKQNMLRRSETNRKSHKSLRSEHVKGLGRSFVIRKLENEIANNPGGHENPRSDSRHRIQSFDQLNLQTQGQSKENLQEPNSTRNHDLTHLQNMQQQSPKLQTQPGAKERPELQQAALKGLVKS